MSENSALEFARRIALERLTVRAQSELELRNWLIKKNTPSAVIDELMTRFIEVGLVNDAQFAQNWVQTRHEVRGCSIRVLRQELRTKGIAEESISAALELIGPESEMAAARKIAEKRLRTMTGLADVVTKRRLIAALARRGFDHDVVLRVVNELMAEPEDNGQNS